MAIRHILHNITGILVLDQSQLAGMIVTPDGCVKLPEVRYRSDIGLVGLGDCSDETAIENKAVIHSVKLTARITGADTLRSGEPYAYILKCVGGDRWLLGSDTHPYPKTLLKRSLPGDPSESSADTLTVELKNLTGLLKVL